MLSAQEPHEVAGVAQQHRSLSHSADQDYGILKFYTFKGFSL